MKFRPLQDRVLIRRIEEEEKTAGGIIIPDTAKEKPMEGEVIAAGRAPGTMTASSVRSMSKSATGCCSGSGREPRSKSTARISWSLRRATSWAWSTRLRHTRWREGRRLWRQRKSAFIPMRASGCCAA